MRTDGIDKERLLDTFLELVQIDSPSGFEAEVARYCKQVLEEAGCAVRLDDSSAVTGSNTGNLIAVLPARESATTITPVTASVSAPASISASTSASAVADTGVGVGGDAGAGASTNTSTSTNASTTAGVSTTAGANTNASLPLFFSAHMDTVSPGEGVKPLVRDGVIYSDGTTVLGGDDKVGIAAIIELIRFLHEHPSELHPEIRVLLSVREEQGLLGAKAFADEEFAGMQGALCYVLDAAGKPGLVVNGAPYQYSYTAEYTGTAAHAGVAPENGVSAIRMAASAITRLPQGRIDEQTTTNVGTIKGGSATNVVAADCVITGELRSHDEDRLLAIKAIIDDTLKNAVPADAGSSGLAQVAIQWEVNYEGYYAAADSPQVVQALKAARALGLDAKTERSGGGADVNILAAKGLAAVSLGCGMEGIHATDERLAVEDLENLACWILQIVKEG